MFKLPQGVNLGPRGSTFDPNFGLDDKPGPPGISTQEIGRRANKWLERYGYTPLRREDALIDIQYIASEVGDDEQTVSNSKLFIALQLVFHEMLGLKISLEDTSINPRFGNFAEDLIILPDGYAQTYLNSRKTGLYEGMSYLDVPKLRLATDIRPMRMDHSATNDGKAAMVGSRQRWIPKNSPIKGIYEIFSLYQDIHLGLHRDKKFTYLPSSLGGYGKEPPFGNFSNLERFIHAYKQGSHALLIRNIINRSIDFLGRWTKGEYPEKDPLLSHVVRFQSSFHDWIKGKSIYAPVVWLDAPQGVEQHRAGKFGLDPVDDEILGRLLAERKVISEQQLEIAVEHNELCKALLGAENIQSFKKLRDEARMNFNKFSIFSLENYGMIKELTLNQDARNSTKLRPIEVREFYHLVSQSRYNLKHIFGEEFVYWPEAMDEIYKTGPMKVRFTMSPFNKVGTRAFAAQTSEYKSDYESTDDINAISHLEQWVRDGKVGPPPRNIINDDNAIINECAKHTYNIITTDDVKLCRLAASKTGNVIFREPTEWYYKSIYFGAPSKEEFLQGYAPGIDWVQHEDTGSIMAYEEAMFSDGQILEKPRHQRFSLFKKLSEKDKETVILSESFEYAANITALLFDYKNILGLRKSRPVFRQGTRGSSSANWRK